MGKVNGIKVGDMVFIVRGHACALERCGGIPYTVLDIIPQTGGGWACPRCGEYNIAPSEMWAAKLVEGVSGIPLGWLLKIDPPADSETTEQPKEISA